MVTRRARRSTRRASGRRRFARFVRSARRSRYPLRRGVYNPSPTFTETLNYGSVVLVYNPGDRTATLGGLWTIAPNSIPQIDQYSQLYNQICIRKVRLIIVPNYNMESQAGGSGTSPVPAVTVPRLAYAINDSALPPVPTSELDVLTDNGSRIRMMSRPLSISFSPVAQLSQASATGTAPVTKRNQWISMTTAGGLTLAHGGVSFFFTQDVSVTNPPIGFNIYAKVTFSLRDPK